jgi:hypothetical protein
MRYPRATRQAVDHPNISTPAIASMPPSVSGGWRSVRRHNPPWCSSSASSSRRSRDRETVLPEKELRPNNNLYGVKDYESSNEAERRPRRAPKDRKALLFSCQADEPSKDGIRADRMDDDIGGCEYQSSKQFTPHGVPSPVLRTKTRLKCPPVPTLIQAYDPTKNPVSALTFVLCARPMSMP